MATNMNKDERPGFETADVNVMAVGKVGVFLLLTTLVSMALIIGVFKLLQAMEGGQAKAIDPAKLFPQPQLQSRPLVDLDAFHAAENKKLSSYGWVDRQAGVVHIPIDKAMDLLVQKGVAVRTPEPASADGVSQPRESGLGLKMQRPGGPLGEGK